MSETIKIPGRIESVATGKVVTGANAILDDTKGKKQNVINEETDAELLRLDREKQGNLTFDQTPTEDSTNPVTSGGVYAADQMLSQAIEAILLLIPSAASELNKLVDLATMNSSISTATASFKGTYNLVSDLHLTVSATHAQIAAALDALSLGADNNDYAFVQVPNTDTAPTDIAKTERYKFNGENWAYEYDLNNSGFTTAQWNAINSGITTLLVAKLSALPTNEALTLALAGKQDNLTFDNAPTAGSNNPVKSGGIYTRNNEIVALINALDAAKQNVLTFDTTPINGSTNPVTSNGVYLAIQLVQTAVVALDGRMGTAETKISTAEGNIVNLQAAYAALTQSDIVVVSGALPSSGQQQNIIYRQPDQDHTPPQFYSDYMWNGTAWVLMATYNNAIDPRPKKASQNLVTSGGVFDNMGALDVSELNATENPHTFKPYANLDAALADIPSDYQKGGMSIKYVQTSDNKYVQYRLMSNQWSTTPANWQGIDDEPTAGSDNLVKSGSVADALFQDAKSLTFIDNKSNRVAISYFDNPFKVGNYYKVKNTGSKAYSFTLFQDTTVVHGYGTIQPGESIEIYYEEFVGNKIGGWVDDLVYQVTVQNITDDKKIESIEGNILNINDSILNNCGEIFIDNKSNTAAISYFNNPCEVGKEYVVSNLTNTNYSFTFYDSSKNIISSVQIQSGDSEIVTCPSGATYIGGWVNGLVYKVGVKKYTDTEKEVEALNNKKSDKDHVKSDFTYTDGYVHGNASAGVIADADYKHTSPIYVTKGTKVYATFTDGGVFSVIAKTDKSGSSYTRLYPQEQTVNGHRVFTYSMTEDCYICISIKKSEGFAYIDTNYSYVSEDTYSTKDTFVVNGDYSVPFTIKKGHRYLVKNSGNVGCSCIPRIIATGENLYRIKSEPVADQILNTDMAANSYGIFVAPMDSYYLIGWSQSQTTISIEDISGINAINDEYTSSIYNKCSNIIIQSREGRVSSVQYPNNSKWGIAEAARNQYDRIRFTIRKTTDGYYFLCHNTTINATARNMDGTVISEPVSSEGKTLAELNEYDWGIQYGEKFAGMQVPMLEDALYYASLYNLGVTFEINSPIVEADYENLFNLAVKYGLIENLVLVKYDTNLYDYFKERNKKVSYWWGGTFAEFELVKDTLKGYLTGENRVYIYNSPYTDYPSTEYLQAIVSNGFTPHFSNIFNENDFIETVKKGIVLIDVANVAFVKSTLRRYADSLIN